MMHHCALVVLILLSCAQYGSSSVDVNINFADMFRGFVGASDSPTPTPTPTSGPSPSSTTSAPTTRMPPTSPTLPQINESSIRCVRPDQVQSSFPPLIVARVQNYFQSVQLLYETDIDMNTTISRLKNYMEDTAYLYLPLTGTFGGPENHGLEGLVEYSWIVNKYKNGGWSYKNGSIENLVCWDSNDPNTLLVNGTGIVVYNSRYLPDGTLYGGTPVESGSTNYIYFDEGSTLVDHQVTVLGRDQSDSKLIFQMARSPYDVCIVIMKNCFGPNQAFNTLNECIDYQTSLPVMKCSPNFGEGDSYGCRFLHHFMTAFNPTVHCPHTTPRSEVCVDTSCTYGYYKHDFCLDESVCA